MTITEARNIIKGFMEYVHEDPDARGMVSNDEEEALEVLLKCTEVFVK